uniref:Uncharacterized protein n=1 Tax=Rhizophora mucronata TaxID=61149 RepID=A0A2P2N8F6_RHIMU
MGVEQLPWRLTCHGKGSECHLLTLLHMICMFRIA